MKLEEITNGASLDGVEPGRVVTVVAAVSIPVDRHHRPRDRPRSRIHARISGASRAARAPSLRRAGDVHGDWRRSTACEQTRMSRVFFDRVSRRTGRAPLGAQPYYSEPQFGRLRPPGHHWLVMPPVTGVPPMYVVPPVVVAPPVPVVPPVAVAPPVAVFPPLLVPPPDAGAPPVAVVHPLALVD